MSSILNDESPAHDLCADIEELGDNSFAVMLAMEDAFQGRDKINLVLLILVERHFGNPDDDQHHYDDNTYDEVGGCQCLQVCIPDCFKLTE